MTSGRNRKREFDAWLPTATRLLSMSIGSFILVWQTVLENVDRPYLIGGGLTLLLGGGIGLFLEGISRR
jgi:hypothetical protein